ncbi:hypothetical protein [Micromonospora zhanjiangensis]|uniref:Uncharacterized protein n=1 Tax=Micromonospora zhanjiangensis TaxID=1522057 RepID=A0ABV8KX90_9ACTN
MSIEDVKATLRRGNKAVKDARRTLEQANAQLLDATGIALPTLEGSEHAHVQRTRAGLKAAAHEIELTLRRLDAAAEHSTAYLDAIG